MDGIGPASSSTTSLRLTAVTLSDRWRLMGVADRLN